MVEITKIKLPYKFWKPKSLGQATHCIEINMNMKIKKKNNLKDKNQCDRTERPKIDLHTQLTKEKRQFSRERIVFSANSQSGGPLVRAASPCTTLSHH